MDPVYITVDTFEWYSLMGLTGLVCATLFWIAVFRQM